MALNIPQAALNSLANFGPVVRLSASALENRGELVSIELSEARDYLTKTSFMLGVAALLGLLGGFAATITLAAIVWETPYRAYILGGTTTLYLALAAFLATRAIQKLKTWSPLSETRNQLGRDAECIFKNIAHE